MSALRSWLWSALNPHVAFFEALNFFSHFSEPPKIGSRGLYNGKILLMLWLNTLIKREHINSPSLMQTCYMNHVTVIQKMPFTPKNAHNDDNYYVEQYKWTTNSLSSEGKAVKLYLEVIIGSWAAFWISNYSTCSNKLTSNINSCIAVTPTEVAEHTFPASKADKCTRLYTQISNHIWVVKCSFEIRNQDWNPKIMVAPILIFGERKVGLTGS